ncbi:MAG: rod shape-determining protein RodA [Ignavibacteriae bacterium]|jgi:rod shape determining protein RodA|nr:rod shape-determining protein RodA [Ignavibacteriota bacterium]
MSKKLFSKFDIVLFTAALMLTGIGIFAIYSATHGSSLGNTSGTDYYLKQLVFALIGIVMVVVISYIPPKYISRLSYIIYIFAIFLLVLVLIFGKTINGNKSWFYIGGFGIQPSEFAKIATILAVANYFYRGDDEKPNYKTLDIIKASLFVIIPAVLIKLENDTGTTLVMLTFLIPMFFWAGVSPFLLFAVITPVASVILAYLNPLYLIIGLVVLIIALFFFKKGIVLSLLVLVLNIGAGSSVNYLYSKLEPYQQRRITAIFDPSTDPLGSGYNVIQSKVAVGSGGLTGRGFLQGSQTQLKFIPEQWTDFIFCMIGEEFGFIGAVIIIILYLIMIYRLINNAYITKNKFLSLACVGFATIYFFHMFINIGMTIGIMPVIGIPLPLLSFGVSSLLTSLVMVGIALNAYRHKDVFI